MSFFDDDDDQPTRVRSGRPAAPRRPAAAADAGGAPDRNTARTRQGVAIGVGVLVLVLLALGVNGCLNSRRERALKDYNRNVATILADSDQQASKQFFDLLSGGSGAPQDLQVQVNQVRLTAEEDVKRARALDVPGAMRSAQQTLTMTLDLRAEALTRIAERLKVAQGRGAQAETATSEIAGQMQLLLASDVIHAQRTVPLMKQALDDAGVGGQQIPTSRSLPGYKWLVPQTVADAIGGQVATGGTAGGGTIAPGTHGHGLLSTTIGATTLQPDGAANKIPSKPPPTLVVKFQNQGENNERNVVVTARLTAPGVKTVTAKQSAPATTAGNEATVSIKLPSAPAAGSAAKLDVQVGAVPGEKNTDNNKASYTVIFTG